MERVLSVFFETHIPPPPYTFRILQGLGSGCLLKVRGPLRLACPCVTYATHHLDTSSGMQASIPHIHVYMCIESRTPELEG